VSPTLIQNCITNYNFKSNSGWTATSSASISSNVKPSTEGVYGRFVGNTFKSIVDDYLDGTYTDTNTYKWNLAPTSLLPKIEHDTTVDSIKLSGNVTIKHKDSSEPAFVVTESDTTINVPTDITGDFTVEHKIEHTLEDDTTQITRQRSFNVTKSNVEINHPITTTAGQTTIIGDFEVQHKINGQTGNQSSFKVTKDEVFLGPTHISDLTAGKLTVGAETQLEGTLGITGIATLNNGLVVTNGDTTLKKLIADSLEVTNKTTLKGEVQLDNKTTINNSLAITGTTNNISTPTLKVDTITSDSDKVIVDIPLKVNSNLNVEDNINVGTPTTPAATDNGGCIVAQYDIIAEQDLIAKRDISAEGSAAIAGNLTVGTDNNTDTGTIDAKKLVKVPTLDVQTIKNTKTDATTGATLGVSIEDALSITGATSVNNTITAEKLIIPSKIDENGEEKGEVVTPTLRVNRLTSDTGSITVDNKKLIVNKSLEMLAKADATDPALATVEKAVIGDLTVKVDAKLKDSTGKITALNSQITNNATIYDLDVGTNIDTKTLVATDTITAQEVVAEKVTQNGKAVPAIDLVQTGTVYQLQITLDASKK
jgi:hypothetical protein